MKRWPVLTLSLFALLMATGIAQGAPGATFQVDTAADAVDANPGDGLCATADGACSLRAAIQEANALPGDDAITLPPGTYTLTIPGNREQESASGDLDIKSNLTIVGAGANLTTVDGNVAVTHDRVFHVLGASTVSLSGLTITGGGEGHGGGILNDGILTVTASTLTGNVSVESLLSGGAAIFNRGWLVVIDSTLAFNRATDRGGGLYVVKGMAVLRNTSVSNNSAGHGGGLFIEDGKLALLNTTVAGNSAIYDGGGAYIVGPMEPAAPLRGRFFISHSLLADNTAGGVGDDCRGTVASLGYNLLGRQIGCLVSPQPGDQLDVDPLLGPLGDYGGTTFTRALLPGSPAIDAGNPAGCTDERRNLLVADQRGYLRPVDGDGDGSAICDPGAFEFNSTP